MPGGAAGDPAPGETELWRRLLEAAVTTHELTRAVLDGEVDPVPPDRDVELVEAGPPVDPAPPVAAGGPTVVAFSGGKDSLLQVALLREMGVPTVAVTTTSPLPGLHDHGTARRRIVLAAVGARAGVEVVEVASDLRAAVDNEAPHGVGWPLSLNEMADTHLYLAAALLVGWGRGAARVLLASEAELQETAVVAGRTVQHPHLMYAAATQQALGALLARWGMAHSSLTYPLRSGQVQHLLWTRYPDLRDLQYSCWRVGPDEAACSTCSQCLRVALAALAAGGDPAEIGVDLLRLLPAVADWAPAPPSGRDLPDDRVKASLHGQVVRHLHAVRTRRVARALARRPGRLAGADGRAALRAYRDLRARVVSTTAPEPPPPYRRGFLALVDPALRDGLAAICDDALVPGDPADDAGALARIDALVAWTVAPLGATP